MKRHLSKKEIKNINSKLKDLYGRDFFSVKDPVVILDEKIIIKDKPYFFLHDELPVPLLKLELRESILPKVTIDMPAVKFIVNGADLMRPGITALDQFNKDDFVVVVDENYGKPIAIGKAKFSSVEIEQMQKGKVIKSLHYVGDEIWKAV